MYYTLSCSVIHYCLLFIQYLYFFIVQHEVDIRINSQDIKAELMEFVVLKTFQTFLTIKIITKKYLIIFHF